MKIIIGLEKTKFVGDETGGKVCVVGRVEIYALAINFEVFSIFRRKSSWMWFFVSNYFVEKFFERSGVKRSFRNRL